MNKIIALTIGLFLFAACGNIEPPVINENGANQPGTETLNANSDQNTDEVMEIGALGKRGSNNGKGKGGNGGDDPVPDPTEDDPFVVTYIIDEIDEWDALYKFSISESGTLMKFETDPTITSWGTDYWGSWADPFPYKDNKVNIIKGLTNTTYEFEFLSDGRVDIVKTLITQPYPSGTPRTTVTHPGIYKLLQ